MGMSGNRRKDNTSAGHVHNSDILLSGTGAFLLNTVPAMNNLFESE